jgi:hypothetical protein
MRSHLRKLKNATILLALILQFQLTLRATVSINLSAGTLADDHGVPMPLSGLVILVASTSDANFIPPTPTSFVSGDDIELARWDLSNFQTPGAIIDGINGLILSGTWGAGDPLAIYWFPSLTTGAAVPGNGTHYGFYHGGNGSDGSEPWFTPGDGGSISLLFLTQDQGGSNPDAAGYASFIVSSPPVITSQPASRTNVFGSTATFAVSATGSNPAYQWRKNGANLANSGNISGALSTSLTLSGITLSDAGNYTVVVTNSAGAVTSSVAVLTVIQAGSALAVASSANPALPATAVTFTATATAVPPGAGVPSGFVQFRADGSALGSPAALSGGAASLTISSLSHGSHTVTAEYAGDANFLGATNALTPNQVINAPPVLGARSIYRYPARGVKVSLATLMAGGNDPDGDALTITVSGTSTNNGTIVVHDGWAFYTPPPAFTNGDSFAYTATDSLGGSSSGTVTVAIKVDDEPGQNLTATDLGNGSVLITGSAVPGRTYTIQYTENLPAPEWISSGTATADSTGSFQFIDTPPPGSATRFYHSTYP